MSEDHKPSREDEAKRIKDAGGFVISHRVMGELSVSRAFGDCEFKKGIEVCYMCFTIVMLTIVPQIATYTCSESCCHVFIINLSRVTTRALLY